MDPTHDYAVFAEYSPESKAMGPGWNTRVFNKIEAQAGESIGLDTSTGVIALAPGTYHIAGFSTVTYATFAEPPETATTRSPAAAGYCRLRFADQDADLPNERAIAIGGGSTANMTPSLIDTYFTTEVRARILLEHQCGHNPQGVYLRVYTENSSWHVQARLSIRRLPTSADAAGR